MLIKPIKVPHVDAAKQTQIIAFEAQNNIPFPLSEAVWGSQVIADDGIETEVLLAAQKAEAANRFCGLMATIGFQPVSLQPSSLLDYNAYKLVHAADTEDTLMINVGARSTNLTFISPAGPFIRNVNLGGNALTQALADGMGKAFPVAEDLKISFYSGQTAFEADDPAVSPLQARAQDFMRRLSQQVTQSIIAYRRASNRAAPQRILLTGRGSLLDGLPEFLSESQKVSVDYFNPGTVVKSGGRLGQGLMEQYYYQISECVGEAARLAKKDAMGINLLPPVIQARMAFNKQKPFLVLAAALLALAPAPMLWRFYQQKAVATKEKASWDSRARTLNNLSSSLSSASTEAQNTRNQIANLEGLMKSRFNWIIFFEQLQNTLVDIKDVWLISLNVDREAAAAAPSNGAAPAAPAAAAPGAVSAAAPKITYKLNLTGRVLLHAQEGQDQSNKRALQASAGEKLNTLRTQLLANPFVESVEPIVPDFDIDPDGRLAGFSVTVVIKPDKPL